MIADTIKTLARDGFVYLATPYSLYPGGQGAAYQDACRAAAWFVRHGIGCFCPIAHTHGIASFGQLSLTDHELWLPADRPFMDAARALVVAQMPTWERSHGIAHEIEVFRASQKPIVYLPWPFPENP